MLNYSPLTPAIGAEVSGVDLKGSLSRDTGAEMRNALAQFHVLFFRDQFLSIEEQKHLTRLFGTLLQLPYVSPVKGEPEVIRVQREANEGGGVFGGDWHQDFSFLERPPAGSILSAVDVPPYGGDTLWASQTLAWETLPEHLRDLLRGRDAIHVGKPYGVRWAPPIEERSSTSITMHRGDPQADEERRHPTVIRNPITGREALFLNPLYVVRLGGMSETESRPLLDQVQHHSTRPEFSCRFDWSAGAVAIWDNLFTQHFAVNDYRGYRREMYRTTFSGPEPRSLAG